MKPQAPDEVLKETVEKTIDIVTDDVERGSRSAEATVGKVVETVANKDVKAAVEASDQLHEDTRRAMNSQHPDREISQKDEADGGRSEEQGTGGPKPDQHKRGMGG